MNDDVGCLDRGLILLNVYGQVRVDRSLGALRRFEFARVTFGCQGFLFGGRHAHGFLVEPESFLVRVFGRQFLLLGQTVG